MYVRGEWGLIAFVAFVEREGRDADKKQLARSPREANPRT